MSNRTRVGTLDVAEELYRFVETELLSAIPISSGQFWGALEQACAELAPVNASLLEERDRLQALIDGWLGAATAAPTPEESAEFLTSIGYLVAPPPPFEIQTTGVDPEISEVAGPQLVVPVLNARFALNAVNARWGSLYDALYGTDALGSLPRGADYDPRRGGEVVRQVREVLDEVVPLDTGSHATALAYVVGADGLEVRQPDGGVARLVDRSAFRGHRGDPAAPTAILLRHHGLHLEIVVDREGRVGRDDGAGVDDVLLESAVTTIVDFEDSVAAVDAQDKVRAYRNWLGLNRGDLEEVVVKGGTRSVRGLVPDRDYLGPGGAPLTLPGRSLMLARNVGHHMRTDAVRDFSGAELPEGILDAFVTVAAALPGRGPAAARRNGSTGAIYVVKPKMHGPEEVAFTARLFAMVEDGLGLPRCTVKIGVMDEERRTSVNLEGCIHAVRDRIVFVNTGFLDRSGDEIHTAMEAGPLVRKAEMRAQPWLAAYEDRNVDVALAAGFRARAQIGKGMWAMPDLMASMLEQKIGHPLAGASTAWVPSPTAATLHALHYHRIDVPARQDELASRERRPVTDLLRLPVVDASQLSPAQRRAELEDNAQSILGYVVRWVDQGIGCSKVPDASGVALMEDRATLRISSQLMANWLRHDVISEAEVRAAMLAMASVVDSQNSQDPAYRPMAADPDSSPAFQAALELVLAGAAQPNGYCEPVLHRWRRRAKGLQAGSS
ncbi:malate synthase G [Nocardioides sp. QY071]|uniref:malate synthase G n=1 Tax=Nocardioides sp. QY071 TaxID=3044187 RepID=UPI00249B3E14|nr:malate synthase G [Nocardioides sp. QY071]WGY00368.1 malate synthase G [Nocardioides sp. QY071]